MVNGVPETGVARSRLMLLVASMFMAYTRYGATDDPSGKAEVVVLVACVPEDMSAPVMS